MGFPGHIASSTTVSRGQKSVDHFLSVWDSAVAVDCSFHVLLNGTSKIPPGGVFKTYPTSDMSAQKPR